MACGTANASGKISFTSPRKSFDPTVGCFAPLATVQLSDLRNVLTSAVTFSAWVLAQLGDERQAKRPAPRRRTADRAFGDEGIRERSRRKLPHVARACLLLGRLDEARSLGDRAVEHSSTQPAGAAYSWHLLGDIATYPHRFDADSGETHYRKAIALAEQLGTRPLIAHCHLGLGKLYRRIGQSAQAHEQLTAATTMYREMDMRFYLDQAEAAMREFA